jgi:hypothetical protein
LDLRRYATTKGILAVVTLEEDGSDGRVVFGSTAEISEMQRSFQVFLDRKSIMIDPPRRPLNFLGLPFQIYDKIIKYASYQKHGIVTYRNTVF